MRTPSTGPNSVGLITLDTYRVGGHEQLRTYGRMLGVVAHLAHDKAALQDLLGLLGGQENGHRSTPPVWHRATRASDDILDVLDLPGMCSACWWLNAGCHGDTLDDVPGRVQAPMARKQAILSKVDEAVKLGPALDALIRHQMVLRGVTNGQRVPEDLEACRSAQAHQRTRCRAPSQIGFRPQARRFGLLFLRRSPLGGR